MEMNILCYGTGWKNILYRCSHNRIHCQSDSAGMLPPMSRPRSYNRSKRRKSKQLNGKRNGKRTVFVRGIRIKCSSCSCISDPRTCKICISCKAKIGRRTSLEISENWTGAGDCWIILSVPVCTRLWMSPDKSAECCPQPLRHIFFSWEQHLTVHNCTTSILWNDSFCSADYSCTSCS